MSFKRKYIVATRLSLLASTQTEQTVKLLREKNPDCEFEIIKFKTHGDRLTDKPLTEFGGTGVFVKELENALLEGIAHIAIHSLKDVPSIQPEKLKIVSFPLRENPGDVVLTRNDQDFRDLPEDCIIGTGSPRRIVQIAQIKPNAKFKDIRGNIDTRIKKLDDGEYDAIVVAVAGLNRMSKHFDKVNLLSFAECIPAIGQGTIALECKSENDRVIKILRSINHADTEMAVMAERSFMKTIGGGCKFPLGAHATIHKGHIMIDVMIGDLKTMKIIRFSDSAKTKEAEILGKTLAEKIMKECKRVGLDYHS